MYIYEYFEKKNKKNYSEYYMYMYKGEKKRKKEIMYEKKKIQDN